jgi:hypothetical protein
MNVDHFRGPTFVRVMVSPLRGRIRSDSRMTRPRITRNQDARCPSTVASGGVVRYPWGDGVCAHIIGGNGTIQFIELSVLPRYCGQ